MIDKMMAHPKLTMYAGLAVLAAVGYAYWRLTDDDTSSGFIQDVLTGAGEAAWDMVDDVIEPINPASQNNLAHKGVNWLGATVTGDENWSLGTAVYDRMNNGITFWDRINPASDKNALNSYTNWFGQTVSGNENWTLGTALYDWTH